MLDVLKRKSSLLKSRKTTHILYNLFTLWFPKELTRLAFAKLFDVSSAQTLKCCISTSGNLFSKIFFVSDHQIVYSKLYKNHCRYILMELMTKLEKTPSEIIASFTSDFVELHIFAASNLNVFTALQFGNTRFTEVGWQATVQHAKLAVQVERPHPSTPH